jgi:hypothetical protein
MTVRGKPGKPTAGFPPFPPPLEIALRFPHSNSSDGPRKSVKPKAGFPLPLGATILLLMSKKNEFRYPDSLEDDSYRFGNILC